MDCLSNDNGIAPLLYLIVLNRQRPLNSVGCSTSVSSQEADKEIKTKTSCGCSLSVFRARFFKPLLGVFSTNLQKLGLHKNEQSNLKKG